MTAPDVKIGDEVVVVELRGTFVHRTMINGETPTMWIVETGSRYRKSDGARVPRYLDMNRRIITVAEYEASRGTP